MERFRQPRWPALALSAMLFAAWPALALAQQAGVAATQVSALCELACFEAQAGNDGD